MALYIFRKVQGCSQEFSRGGGEGEITLCQSEGTHQIIMSFLPPVKFRITVVRYLNLFFLSVVFYLLFQDRS